MLLVRGLGVKAEQVMVGGLVGWWVGGLVDWLLRRALRLGAVGDRRQATGDRRRATGDSVGEVRTSGSFAHPGRRSTRRHKGMQRGQDMLYMNSRRKTIELKRSSRSTSSSAAGRAPSPPSFASWGATRTAKAVVRRWWGLVYAWFVLEERMPRPRACHRSAAAGREPEEPEEPEELEVVARLM